MLSTRALITALAVLSTVPAAAQVSQYTAPGGLLDRSISKKEQMEESVENARWRLGPFRLSPWFAVRDAAYVSDIFAGSPEGAADQALEREPDFTVTVGAGLQGFLPLGPKMYLTADALPQYVYWQDHDERRRLNGYYGVGLLGFFNRLTAQANARQAEEQAVLTPEYEQRVHTRQDLVEALFDVQVARSLYVFASAAGLETVTLSEENGDDPRLPPFEQLDRQERVLRGGIEYRFRERLRLAAGIERTEADFLKLGRDRSNRGTSPLLEFDYTSDRLQLSGGLSFRSLEPQEGSEFVPFEETSGQLLATLTPRWRLGYSLYGSRDLTYSLREGYSHFTADRLGASVSSKLGLSSSVHLFAETGTHDYAPLAGSVPDQEDDFLAYGSRIHLQLQDRVRFSVAVTRSELDSSLPGLDRSLTVVQSSFEISAFGGALTVR